MCQHNLCILLRLPRPDYRHLVLTLTVDQISHQKLSCPQRCREHYRRFLLVRQMYLMVPRRLRPEL
jgi:hypothetical protein